MSENTLYLLFSARYACAIRQLLLNLHTLHVQFAQETKQNKKILRKYGIHEAPPKPQFDEYYGIFRPEQFQNCQGKPHILSVNGCLLNQNTTTNNREC